ncbi:UDP-N-acetylmuramate dehydrogenase [Candidatus Peregrinibacteria bacterium]|nr:UDP-N-acetylmuramate dehydrogenase [Candidatus Peregrinibacteria bacterium]
MDIIENIPLGPKTTMRIGGTARYFAELGTQKDVEAVVVFAEEKKLPLVMLGGGSNTIFADGMVEAVVVRVTASAVTIENCRPPLPSPPPKGEGISVHVEAGKILASLLNELAEQNLDLSPITGIPGTVGGAIFGNAGQGFGGTWIGHFVKDVTFYHEKQWKTWKQEECEFGYRESWFKYAACDAPGAYPVAPHPNPSTSAAHGAGHSPLPRGEGIPIIWSATLSLPTRPKEEIQTEIERLLQKRIATQPHLKTAGSCFKSLPDGTPAWKLIDAAGLRGFQIGDVQVAKKHANFLLNVGKASFNDVIDLIQKVRSQVGQPLDIEMRLVGPEGLTVR